MRIKVKVMGIELIFIDEFYDKKRGA